MFEETGRKIPREGTLKKFSDRALPQIAWGFQDDDFGRSVYTGALARPQWTGQGEEILGFVLYPEVGCQLRQVPGISRRRMKDSNMFDQQVT